jgi:predicted AlkP superfamily phosphohydrolase/phosphomutase
VTHSKRRRLLVFGLDGATESVIGLPDAALPALERMRRTGAAGRIISTTPPVTAAAWPSMLTGLSPGSHGIFDFQRTPFDWYPESGNPGAAEYQGTGRFHDSRSWRGLAFWDVAGARSRCAILGVPMTYPTWDVNGVMLAGFPLPDYGTNHWSPPRGHDPHAPILEHANELRDFSDEELAHLGLSMIARQIDVCREFVDDPAYDCVFAVFQATDFAQHRLWKYLRTPGHPLRSALLEMYATIDRYLAETLEAHPDANVVVVSDHGFRAHPPNELNINAVLARAGLLDPAHSGGANRLERTTRYIRHSHVARSAALRLASVLPGRLVQDVKASARALPQIEWATTRAFRIPLCAPLEGVMVNLEGRQPLGAVPVAELESTRAEIIELLSTYVDPHTGIRPVEWARRREDVYTGPAAADAPDVIVSLCERYRGGPGVRNECGAFSSLRLKKYSGIHAQEGVIRMTGPNIAPGAALGETPITDVGPTLLALLGVAADGPTDGAPIAAALCDLPDPLPGERIVPPPEAHPQTAAVYTGEEEQMLESSLRALGYLE